MIMNSVRENPMLNSEGANSISPMGYNVRTAVSQLGNDVLGMDPSSKTVSSKDELRGIYNSPVFNMKKN